MKSNRKQMTLGKLVISRSQGERAVQKQVGSLCLIVYCIVERTVVFTEHQKGCFSA